MKTAEKRDVLKTHQNLSLGLQPLMLKKLYVYSIIRALLKLSCYTYSDSFRSLNSTQYFNGLGNIFSVVKLFIPFK